ncbi:hypothetical protein [Clostridium sp.]|uniref:hypothetical protein n=1 Tax=Clostridium sp. TaxID=1506 RepID=UPI003217A24E
MFEIESKYSKEIQELINEIEEKQIGVQVIKVKDWALPINKYNLELEISKAKNLNIIEEFIIKIALANMGYEVTEEVIQSMLGLDEVFTSQYINRLADAGVIDKKELPKLHVTKLGKQQFEKGQVLTKDRKETITAFIQPKFKLFYSKVHDQKSVYPLMHLEDNETLLATTIENDSKLMNQVIDIAKEDKIIVNRESVNQFVSKINSVIPIGNPVGINFIEFWIYDIIEDKLYCRVWDCQQGRYNNELSEYLMKTKPLTKNDFEIKNEVYDTKDTIPNKYEEIFKEEVKAQRSEGTSSKLTLRMVRGGEIKKEFDKCLNAVKKYLYIQSPWISDYVVDNKMIEVFKNLVNKNCKIFISWGIARDINKEDRKPAQELIDQLRSIKGPNGMPGVFIYWVGNHHNKEIIVDDNSHLAGSFNWLSYRGDYLPRGESVYITNDKAAIHDAKMYWEEQVFNKVSTEIWKEDYIREINALINLETTEVKARTVILEEINNLFKQKDSESEVKLYNIALIYFRNQLFDDVFINIISNLIEKNKYLRESYIMINYLKKNNNSKIYEGIIEKYKDKFIESQIINDKLKPHNSLNKKNIANELKFK